MLAVQIRNFDPIRIGDAEFPDSLSNKPFANFGTQPSGPGLKYFGAIQLLLIIARNSFLPIGDRWKIG